MFQLHLPMNLKVGTLDELMLISDELSKLDAETNAIAGKIMRKYAEVSGPESKPLSVEGLSPRKYWETFQWNVAAYPYTRKLPQIAKIVRNHIKTANASFQHISSALQEAKNKLTTAQRRAGGNLLVADLNDVMAEIGRDPKEVFKEMEFLKRVAVVVPTNDADKFLSTYSEIDSSAITVFRESNTSYEKPCPVPKVAPVTCYKLVTENGRVVEVRLGVGRDRSPTVWQLKSAAAEQHKFDYSFVQLWAHDRVLGDTETLESAGVDLKDEKGLKVIFESPSLNRNRVADGHLSPAVPGSAEFLCKDEDGYSMYSMCVVRGRDDVLFDSFKTSCQSKRITIREYVPTKSKGGAEQKSIKKIVRELESKERDARLDFLKRCPGYFNTVYTALAHIKAIRVFAESVLRYGVPPNFISIVVDYQGRVKLLNRTEKALGELYSGLDILGIAKVTDKASQAEQSLLDKSQQTFYPYVYLPVDCMDFGMMG